MNSVSNLLVVFVAMIHFGIMGAELFPPEHPLLLSRIEARLGFAEGQGRFASPIVQNAGIYNGFLGVGLLWGWRARFNTRQIRVFFLACVIVAGLFGAATLPTLATLWLQAVPGAVALTFNLTLWQGIPS